MRGVSRSRPELTSGAHECPCGNADREHDQAGCAWAARGRDEVDAECGGLHGYIPFTRARRSSGDKGLSASAGALSGAAFGALTDFSAAASGPLPEFLEIPTRAPEAERDVDRVVDAGA